MAWLAQCQVKCQTEDYMAANGISPPPDPAARLGPPRSRRIAGLPASCRPHSISSVLSSVFLSLN